MEDGRIEVGDDLFVPKGDLQVRSLSVKGLVWRVGQDGPKNAHELEAAE